MQCLVTNDPVAKFPITIDVGVGPTEAPPEDCHFVMLEHHEAIALLAEHPGWEGGACATVGLVSGLVLAVAARAVTAKFWV